MEQNPHSAVVDAQRTAEIAEQVEAWADFSTRLHKASLTLSLAFAEDRITFRPVTRRSRGRLPRPVTPVHWFTVQLADIQRQITEVRAALSVDWRPTQASEPLARKAFSVLADAAPARAQLLRLFESDIREAFRELAKHVEIRGAEISHAAGLLARDEEVRAAENHFHDRFEAALDELLRTAGGTWTLTEAAEQMGISKAAVHKKLTKHQALAVMRDGRLLLPRAQFVAEPDGRAEIVAGLDEVLRVFEKGRAGPAGALEFLTSRNPILESTPFEALAANDPRVADVAAAYLQLDEQ